MAALTPPVVVITGGHRGVGLETSRQGAQQGLSIVLTRRGPAQEQRTADRLRAQGLAVVSRPLREASSAP